MTQAELEMRLAIWQKRLRCQDWEIVIRFTPDLQSEGCDCWGTCSPDRYAMTAVIDVRSTPFPDGSVKPVDWVIAHELQHVLAPEIKPEEYEEPFINRIAWALYNAYRNDNGGLVIVQPPARKLA